MKKKPSSEAQLSYISSVIELSISNFLTCLSRGGTTDFFALPTTDTTTTAQGASMSMSMSMSNIFDFFLANTKLDAVSQVLLFENMLAGAALSVLQSAKISSQIETH